MSKQKVEVKTELEMLEPLKLLLNNGYDVAVRKRVNILSFENQNEGYTLLYQKTKG